MSNARFGQLILAAAFVLAGCGSVAVSPGPVAVVSLSPAPSQSPPPPMVRPTATPRPTPTATPVPSNDELQGHLDALRAAGDCASVESLDASLFGNAGDGIAEDYEAAVEDCSFGVLFPTPEPGRVTVKGDGSRKTKPFSLASDDYDVVIKGKGGRGNVAVVLYTVSGEYQDLLVNEISPGGVFRYETAQYDLGCATSTGCYYLDAAMPDGDWTVTFTPMD